jgi:hypothetical protein
VSGVVFVALFFAGAGATATLATSVEFADAPIDSVMARQFPQFGNVLLFVFAMRMAAIFVITNIGRTMGVLPRWFVWAGFVVALFLLLSVSFYPALVLVCPIWLIALSVLLLVRARQIPVEVPPATWTRSDRPQTAG